MQRLTYLVSTPAILIVIGGCPGPSNPLVGSDAGTTNADSSPSEQDGALPLDCTDDPITAESFEAAQTALASGSNSVAISERGCLRYERRVEGELVTSEMVTDDDFTVLTVERTITMTTMSGDFDHDGTEDWSRIVIRGETALSDRTVTTWFVAGTPSARRTYTRPNEDTIHVVVEENQGGSLVQIDEFDTPRFQAATSLDPSEETPTTETETRLESETHDVPAAITTVDCSATLGPQIAQSLREAISGLPRDPNSGVLACMRRMRLPPDQYVRMVIAMTRDIQVTCVPNLGRSAVYDGAAGWFDRRTEIRVDPMSYESRTANNRRQLFAHEIFHELTEHPGNVDGLPRVDEIEPSEACAATCWPDRVDGMPITTKCACARCLETDVCDPRCRGFRDCVPIPGVHQGMLPCVDDPCNPTQHDEAFLRMNCRFRGMGAEMAAGRQVSEAEVTWTFDHVDARRVFLTPSGTITYFQYLPMEAGCTTSPPAPPIATSDGSLVLDYTNVDQPRYSGGGITMWPGELHCPFSDASVPLQCAWFWTDRMVTYPYTPGQPISDTRTVADATATWSFAPY